MLVQVIHNMFGFLLNREQVLNEAERDNGIGLKQRVLRGDCWLYFQFNLEVDESYLELPRRRMGQGRGDSRGR